MKKIIIHTIPIIISLIWLIVNNDTFNPISLKGPEFLKFYLILLLGFYVSIFILKSFKDVVSKTTFYFMISIFVLGIVKLMRGIILEKPVGFLLIILAIETIIGSFLMLKLLTGDEK
ncbi:hypothetical protein A0O34_09190 [Chryseobacterium glaciei]|uniref:Multipass membrane protein n=1 Tax=Chryseobacterium glaciei TaxID=1685010 RepID=A0A172XUT7_9FLAO|nr:hypothetical protein [Chryseobacterium glaciei]ANF50686.1 hypothetical protein A0O34_09190 [Chryseobacterium glaciei]